MPTGIPYIISNEAAERFSFYGMKAALAIFLANYLGVLGGKSMSEANATVYVSFFNSAVYLTPLLGALIADIFFGKYRTIITLSVVYCLGHLCLAFMGITGSVEIWLLAGLGLIALGAGGIKPCVSAHVGDQFGVKNQHLLTKIFNIFYLSINVGAVISNLAIPWILKWYGPHLAFGLPGLLMVIATITFWIGRNKFIHIPAHGSSFIKELFSREGLTAIGKLIPLFLFVAIFWCLFDQTSSSLVFQAEKMDLHVFGIKVLPSQIQAANPFLILVLIPIFTWGIYPAINKITPLTPLKKVGTGLFIMAISFAIISLAQEAIDRGETPSIWWQLLAYLIFTSAEILISIVCLEFAYTQAPRKIKSFVMAIFLVAVTVGNLITGVINIYIQIPELALTVNENHAGYDKKLGTADDLILYEEKIQSPVTDIMENSAATIKMIHASKKELPTTAAGNKAFSSVLDPWGNALRYTQISSTKARLSSNGPDKKAKTQWDLGIIIEVSDDSESEQNTWLAKEKRKRNISDDSNSVDMTKSPYKVTYYAGGQTSLEGAAYFWFFTKLMLITAVIFIPFSIFYKPKSYLQE